MFTLFALPKAFTGHTAIVQRNALGSWVRLRPAPEIILFGDDPGVEEAARQFGVRHVQAIARNEFGTPLVSDLFQKAETTAAEDVLCYTNADIIFTNDLPSAIESAMRWRARFLLAGRRFDVQLHAPIAFDDGWDARLRTTAHSEGELQDWWWIDYFAFRRGIVAGMPPFAIGRPIWDNWMIYHARRQRVPVIDATEVITAIHQRHDYAHVPQGTGTLWMGPESDLNTALAGGIEHSYSLLDASHRLTTHGVRRRFSPQPIRRRFEVLAASNGPVGRLLRALRSAVRAWRARDAKG